MTAVAVFTSVAHGNADSHRQMTAESLNVENRLLKYLEVGDVLNDCHSPKP